MRPAPSPATSIGPSPSCVGSPGGCDPWPVSAGSSSGSRVSRPWWRFSTARSPCVGSSIPSCARLAWTPSASTRNPPRLVELAASSSGQLTCAFRTSPKPGPDGPSVHKTSTPPWQDCGGAAGWSTRPSPTSGTRSTRR
nr:hypothetical protein [Actinomycetes bacterium]